MVKIHPSEITPEHVYVARRTFIRGAGALAASALVLGGCGPQEATPGEPEVVPTAPAATAGQPAPAAGEDELGGTLTAEDAINGYNNYYEFSFGKEAVAELAENFKISPWTVEVGGLVGNPKTYDLDDLLAFSQEERIYRMRCVEAWSMVIPWLGFPLSALLKEVEPTSAARYVRFETVYDPDQMPGQRTQPQYPWPYVEGLRLDEAMHDLTILATGLYGKALLPQTGAPIRLVVPWKYGFKSIKSIVKIDLVEEMPTSLWMDLSPQEYGFYANVNPNVPHPRWSQATERRIGEAGRRDTLLFNGYADEVADLYADLDLSVWY